MNETEITPAIFNGSRLRKLRHATGRSQCALAWDAGVSQNSIADYESGRHVPNSVTLYRLAKFFNVSMELFFEGDAS